MRKGARTAAWVLASSLVGSVAWSADATVPGAVTVGLADLAGTPRRDLDAARAEVDRIFQAAGVAITWVDGPVMPQPGRLTLFVLKDEAHPGARGDVAGQAVRETSRAYVYRNRLEAMTDHLPVDANATLGRVMAHEIGHLLLPPNSHSRVGIMRAQMDFSQSETAAFTQGQARQLRRAVASGSAQR
jgi:hypothetical protein